MMQVQGFPPLVRPGAHTLVLGSMPGRESLAQQKYYAHPRNAFWPIMVKMFRLNGDSYEERTVALTLRGIAVWDILQACVRPGSLDASIDESSIVANDFAAFFGRYGGIRRVFFNGAKAESMYLRHVLPTLGEQHARIARQRLPSTSPAHAAMTLKQKAQAWRIVLEGMD